MLRTRTLVRTVIYGLIARGPFAPYTIKSVPNHEIPTEGCLKGFMVKSLLVRVHEYSRENYENIL